MTRASIEVVLTMSWEEAEAVRDNLQKDENPKTDAAFKALYAAMDEVSE